MAGRRRRALRHYAGALAAQPVSLTEMLLAVDFATDEAHEVVLVWPEGEPAPEPFLAVLRRTFLRTARSPARRRATRSRGSAGARPSRPERSRPGGRPRTSATAGLCRLPAIAPEKLACELAPARPYE